MDSKTLRSRPRKAGQLGATKATYSVRLHPVLVEKIRLLADECGLNHEVLAQQAYAYLLSGKDGFVEKAKQLKAEHDRLLYATQAAPVAK